MANIAFYLQNRQIKDVDCSDVLNGNPGIGGSDYALLILACALVQNHKDLNVTLYVDHAGLFPSGLHARQVSDLPDLIRMTKEDDIDILILILGAFSNTMLDSFRLNESLKIVIWASNFLSKGDLSCYAGNRQIGRIVCVGFEQLDMYRDVETFKKMTAIYNGFKINHLCDISKTAVPFRQRPPHVTYIGNLAPQKGFYLLARAWPRVLSAYPDAVLNVVGSGKLYNRDVQLGKYGLAEDVYEKAFMPYLTDSDGKILPSVKFHGILGKEKNELLLSTRVGVPNPSGRTETFGYTAIEMQLFGALVTTVECPAYLETVCPSTGLLYRRQKYLDRKLAESIIMLLGREENCYDETMVWLRSNFSIDKVAAEWRLLFTDMMAGKMNQAVPVKANRNYRLKHWKEINRKIKNVIPFGYKILPSLWLLEEWIFLLQGVFMRRPFFKYLYRRYILKQKIEQYL